MEAYHYAQCHYAECHHAECHYDVCRGAPYSAPLYGRAYPHALGKPKTLEDKRSSLFCLSATERQKSFMPPTKDRRSDEAGQQRSDDQSRQVEVGAGNPSQKRSFQKKRSGRNTDISFYIDGLKEEKEATSLRGIHFTGF
jgi:hypothetical protein